jgi:hypothetical protein
MDQAASELGGLAVALPPANNNPIKDRLETVIVQRGEDIQLCGRATSSEDRGPIRTRAATPQPSAPLQPCGPR